MSHPATSRYRTLPLPPVAQCDSKSPLLTPKIPSFAPDNVGIALSLTTAASHGIRQPFRRRPRSSSLHLAATSYILDPIQLGLSLLAPYCSLSTLLFSPFDLHRPFYTQRPFASTGIAPFPRYYGLVRLLLSLSLHAVLPSSLAELSEHATLLCPAEFHPPKPVRRNPVGFMMSEHWPLGI